VDYFYRLNKPQQDFRISSIGLVFFPIGGFRFQLVTICHRLTSKKTANLLSVFAIILTGGN